MLCLYTYIYIYTHTYIHMHIHHVLEILKVRIEEVQVIPLYYKGGASHNLSSGNPRLPSISLWLFRSPSRGVMSSGFGSEEVTNWQRSHFIHSTFVNLEGRSHPAATRTLLTPPAKGAQLRCAFGTQKLSFHDS